MTSNQHSAHGGVAEAPQRGDDPATWSTAEQVAYYVQYVLTEVPGGYFAVATPRHGTGWDADFVDTPVDADKLAERVGEATAAGRDAYACPNRLARPDRQKWAVQGRKADEQRYPGEGLPEVVFADLDGPVLDPDLLDDLDGLVMRTSPGRHQMIVRLSAPVDVGAATALNGALAYALAGDCGDQAPTHQASLLRLPGSYNHKPVFDETVPDGAAHEVVLTHAGGRIWDIDDLRKRVGEDTPIETLAAEADRHDNEAPAASDREVRNYLGGCPKGYCARVERIVGEHLTELAAAVPGQRHKVANTAVTALLHLAAEGHLGVGEALQRYTDKFNAKKAGAKKRHEIGGIARWALGKIKAEPVVWFGCADNACDKSGAVAANELGELFGADSDVVETALSAHPHGVLGWQCLTGGRKALTIATADRDLYVLDPETGAAARKATRTEFEPPAAGTEAGATPDAPRTDQQVLKALPNLPKDFWTTRPELATIQQAAWARARSADAVLLTVLTRIAAFCDPGLKLDIGLGPVSLNLYAALVGGSGVGKTEATNVTDDLAPGHGYPHVTTGFPPSTGQGMCEAYFGKVPEVVDNPETGKSKTVWVHRQTGSNVEFFADEGAGLMNHLTQLDSQLGSVLRSIWTSGKAGQGNASDDRKRILAKGSYSAGLVVGFQPTVIQPLLADEDGTAQRFLYASVLDPAIPRTRRVPWPDEGLDAVLALVHEARGVTLNASDDRKERCWQRNVDKTGGDRFDGSLDSHCDLLNGKVAALLAVLNGRLDGITEEDWHLAEMVTATSRGVRDELVRYGKTLTSLNLEQSDQRAAEQSVRVSQATRRASTAVTATAKVLGNRVHRNNGAKVTRRDLTRAAGSKHKDSFEDGLDEAIASGYVIKTDDGNFLPGESKPA